MPLSQQPPTFKFSKLFWIGIVILSAGSGPLLLTILFAYLGFTRDPNPNPIGFGIMALLIFWPSIGLITGMLSRIFVDRPDPVRTLSLSTAGIVALVAGLIGRSSVFFAFSCSQILHPVIYLLIGGPPYFSSDKK